MGKKRKLVEQVEPILEKVNDNDTDNYEIEKYNNCYRAIYNHLATFKYRYKVTGKETNSTEEDKKNGVSKYKLEICNKKSKILECTLKI